MNEQVLEKILFHFQRQLGISTSSSEQGLIDRDLDIQEIEIGPSTKAHRPPQTGRPKAICANRKFLSITIKTPDIILFKERWVGRKEKERKLMHFLGKDIMKHRAPGKYAQKKEYQKIRQSNSKVSYKSKRSSSRHERHELRSRPIS